MWLCCCWQLTQADLWTWTLGRDVFYTLRPDVNPKLRSSFQLGQLSFTERYSRNLEFQMPLLRYSTLTTLLLLWACELKGKELPAKTLVLFAHSLGINTTRAGTNGTIRSDGSSNQTYLALVPHNASKGTKCSIRLASSIPDPVPCRACLMCGCLCEWEGYSVL